MNNNEAFNYAYSAAEQEEIRGIAEKYKRQPEGEREGTLEQLRRLDKSVTKPGTIVSIMIGIISALILGVGMCCTMVWGGDLFVVGIVIGVVGIAGVLAAYPVYSSITKKRREKLAPEIIRLSDKLMK